MATPRPMIPSMQEHRRMMEQPHRWPHRPLLCLKRYGADGRLRECGVMCEDTTTVFQWPYTMLSPYEPLMDKDTVRYVYPDLDALMADGWIVD